MLGEVELFSVEERAIGRFPMSQWVSPHSSHMGSKSWIHFFLNFFRRTLNWEEDVSGLGRAKFGGSRGRNDQDSLYTCMKFSKNEKIYSCIR